MASKKGDQDVRGYEMIEKCIRCGGLLVDEYVVVEEGTTNQIRCVICGARYFYKEKRT